VQAALALVLAAQARAALAAAAAVPAVMDAVCQAALPGLSVVQMEMQGLRCGRRWCFNQLCCFLRRVRVLAWDCFPSCFALQAERWAADWAIVIIVFWMRHSTLDMRGLVHRHHR
jgi:hypothetical protein